MCLLPAAVRVRDHRGNSNVIGSAALTVSRSSGDDTATILTLYLDVFPKISPLSSADNVGFDQAVCIACCYWAIGLDSQSRAGSTRCA